MSYIQPNSRIEFFDDIGISQDYNDTLYFETREQKDNYFSTIDRLAHVDRCYYVRERRGFVRVELPMNTMIHAQYMRFQNTSYGLKWWYAFVKDVIYINDNTTEVQFEFDPMMSWMGDFTLDMCYVERQHSTTDAVGDNLVDEDFNTGEYVNLSAISESDYASSSYTGFFNRHSNPEDWNNNSDWVYLAFVSEPIALANPVRTGLGVYNGCSIYIFANTEAGREQMNTQLHNADIFGNVISIVLVPEAFIPRIPDYTPPIYSGAVDYSVINRTVVPYIKQFSVPKNFTTLGGRPITVDPVNHGYAPKNNKLFTYPYNFLAVYNSEGQEMIYKYELFNSNNCVFNFTASLTQKPEITCIPVDYRMRGMNLSETISMTNFPMAGWNSDLFMAYVAQSLSTLPLQMAGGYVTSQLMGKAMNLPEPTKRQKKEAVEGLINDSGNSVLQNLSGGVEHALKPCEQVGQTAMDALTIMNHKEFYFYRRTILPEYAKMIDDYFTMFGYAQKKVMTPNMNARQYFTYVKTIGCKIYCRCPASDADFIEELFNKGIRFWKDHRNIGHYELNNAPLNTP